VLPGGKVHSPETSHLLKKRNSMQTGLVPKRYCVVRLIGPLLTSLSRRAVAGIGISPEAPPIPRNCFFLLKKKKKRFLVVKNKSTPRAFYLFANFYQSNSISSVNVERL
jgi:hypothetical protein